MTQYEKMTKTPVSKLICTLSVPTIISMLVTNIYNMADTAFVGQLGTSASGAVGVVFGFMAILQAVGFMFGQGCGSIVSRLLGAKKEDRASVIASTGFFGAFFTAIILGVLGLIFIDPLVKILGSTDTIARYAKIYITYILFAAPFMVPSFTLNNILRYEGKAALGMIGMMSGAVLNIVLDPILMFGFKMGIHGAGLSTALSQVVSFSILISMFVRGKSITKLRLNYFFEGLPEIGNICATGLPSLLRQGLGSLTTMCLNFEAAVYGDAAVAAMSIVSRVSFFVFSFSLGIGQGFQPVCGFNYGAGKYQRLRKAFWFTAALAEGLVILMCIPVIIQSPYIVRIFRDDPEVIEIGTRALNLQLWATLFLPPCMVTEMMYQSTGHRFGASLMSALRSGLLFIPMLLMLAAVRGLPGIQEAQPLSTVLSIIPMIIFLTIFMKKLPNEDAEDPKEAVENS